MNASNPLDIRRPEAELLFCCARAHRDETASDRIRTLTQKSLDWVYLMQWADQHGIMPLLYASLQKVAQDQIPKLIWEQLELNFFANAARNTFVTNYLVKMMGELDECGIPVIPFKGPVFAMMAYRGDLSLRQFGDLDLLVHERDFPRCRDFLYTRGFNLRMELDFESSFVNQESNVCIDLHWRIAPAWRFPFQFDFDRLWKHRQTINVIGSRLPSLCPEDTLMVLCGQTARDIFGNRARLSKIADIAELLYTHQQLNWGFVREEARRSNCQHSLIFGLYLVHELLGVALPTEIRRLSKIHWLVRLASAHARQQFFGTAGKSYKDHLLRVCFEFWIQETLRDTPALRKLLGSKLVDLLAFVKRIKKRFL
jgi:hypothetical protein